MRTRLETKRALTFEEALDIKEKMKGDKVKIKRRMIDKYTFSHFDILSFGPAEESNEERL